MAKPIETFLDPAKFTEELTSKLKEYRLPGIDFDAVVASQRKNVEALVKASRAASPPGSPRRCPGPGGFPALDARINDTATEGSLALPASSQPGSPLKIAARQARKTGNCSCRP